jgi:hypothetical protein
LDASSDGSDEFMKPGVRISYYLVARKTALLLRRLVREWLRVGGSLVGTILITILLGACAQMGPQVLETGRPQYNIAVQQTEAQQLLLNIVRQRYNDPILFLDVTSISSGFSRGVNANLLSSFGSGSN